MSPRYPEIQVATRSRNPLALVAAVRYALRRAHIDRGEIRRFSTEALSAADPRPICRRWVKVRNGA